MVWNEACQTIRTRSTGCCQYKDFSSLPSLKSAKFFPSFSIALTYFTSHQSLLFIYLDLAVFNGAFRNTCNVSFVGVLSIFMFLLYLVTSTYSQIVFKGVTFVALFSSNTQTSLYIYFKAMLFRFCLKNSNVGDYLGFFFMLCLIISRNVFLLISPRKLFYWCFVNFTYYVEYLFHL